MGLFHRKVNHEAPLMVEKPGFSVKLPRQPSTLAPEGTYTNADLDPTLPNQRTWGAVTWWTFWVSAAMDSTAWQTGGSLVGIGLDIKHSLIVVLVGNCLIAVPIILNGAIGSQLRIPFPVAARASFGVYFSYFPIISRMILAWFWFGIQTYNGGSAMTQALRAIWPSYNNIANHLPASAGFTTKDMLSFFIFSVVQLPFFFIGPNKLRWFFMAKCIIVPATALGMMGYLVHASGGGGPLVAQAPTATGSDFSKAWLLSLASVMGNWATLAVNAPDFTRYASSTKAQWMQFPAIPICGLFICLTGIFGASASTTLYGGEALWSPFDILAQWDNRAAVFFCAVGWMVGGIAGNISTNSISAANDLVTLFPRYINITRGQIITALIGGWAMVPWLVLSSALSFLNFMSGYSVIMAPMAAILSVDYWLVKKRAYHVPELYDPRGIYRYEAGFNWRAVVTVIACIAPNLPGLINAVNPDIDVGNISWYYAPGFITGYVPACVLYVALNFFFPHFPTLLAAAVTADDVDTTVEPVQDGSWDGKSAGQDYEMGQIPEQQHHVNY
ncbi:NCS1 nucleoside transporter family [Leucosporidium creatinivorum]|uniref:NCS1 nucleoside transporter family n=1 Tax=Leucosporidium creatinivorum TaxID=106004 RepID=A0A1Y2FJG1_9BASI|nr:NCS1 nucleoside transporter family [Leucosporidium creatinivorum]